MGDWHCQQRKGYRPNEGHTSRALQPCRRGGTRRRPSRPRSSSSGTCRRWCVFFSLSSPVVSRAGSSLFADTHRSFFDIFIFPPRGDDPFRPFSTAGDPPDVETDREIAPVGSPGLYNPRSSRTPGYEIRSPIHGRGTTRTASRTRRPRSPWAVARRSSTRRR